MLPLPVRTFVLKVPMESYLVHPLLSSAVAALSENLAQ